MQHIYIQIGGDIYIYIYMCMCAKAGGTFAGASSARPPSIHPPTVPWADPLNFEFERDATFARRSETYIYMYISMYVCKIISTHYFVWLFFSLVLLLFNPWEKLHMGPLDNSTTAWHKRKLNVMVATETIPPTVGIVFICHQHHQTMCYYQYCMQTAGSW